MKTYIKPTLEVIMLRPEEHIASPGSITKTKSGNNGWGNKHQSAPGNSLPHNNAENDQSPRTRRHKH